MKKFLPTIFIAVAVLLIGGAVLMPHIALATDNSTAVSNGTTLLGGATSGFVNGVIAWFANFLLSATSWLVTVTAILLNISINITTHIQERFFNSATATSIDNVWIIVRDLSSMFIIFSLLYCSILTILGQAKTGFNKLVINIFIAGMLINFSLFFTKVAVDASNLVSLQFYEAIAPQTSTNADITSAFNSGGISNVFMNSLRIPTIYGNRDALKTGDVVFGIALATVGGIIMMVVTAFSFLAASIAFLARTGILLLIMTLSPLYFAGMIFPQIQSKVSDKLMKYLKAQLIFMPVYLFLLYIALRIISDPTFMAIFNSPSSTSTTSSGPLGAVSIGIMIQYTIAILFINAPLVAAIEFGAVGASWAPQAGAVSGKFSGFAGRWAVARPLAALGKSYDRTAAQGTFFGSTSLNKYGGKLLTATKIGPGIRGTLDKAAKGKYGGTQSVGDIEKEEKTRSQFVESKATIMARGADIKKAIATSAPLTDVKKITSKMNGKELEGLDDNLMDPKVAASLSSKQVENILKSAEVSEANKTKFKQARVDGLKAEITTISSGDVENILKEEFSEDQKKEIKDARTEGLKKLVDANDDKGVESYMKNLSGKELAKMDGSILKQGIVIDYLTTSQLKDMLDLKGDIKKSIGDYIDNLPVGDHKAKGYIKKNRTEWE